MLLPSEKKEIRARACAAAEAEAEKCLNENVPREEIPDRLRKIFNTFDKSEASKLFRETGMRIAEEVEGRLEPTLH
jgi:hypothetical protein